MFFRRDLPQLFEAEAEFLRLAAFGQTEALRERLGEAAARALGEQRVFRAQLHAAGEAILVMAVLGETHVAGGDAGDRAAAIEQHFDGGKARIDFNPRGFRLGRKPAADVAERDDVISVVVHQRRQHDIWQPHSARRRQPIEAVVAHLAS